MPLNTFCASSKCSVSYSLIQPTTNEKGSHVLILRKDIVLIFVLRKKGRKTKKRMKEEEIGKAIAVRQPEKKKGYCASPAYSSVV